MSHPDQPMPAGAVRRRERGLRRVGRTTRWLAATAAAGSVALAAGYANALPGKSSPEPATAKIPSHPAAPSRTSTPTVPSAPHATVPKQRKAPVVPPATHTATPAPSATKPPAATPQASHTTSGAS
ncbi:hypothetical protein AB0L59_19045 [Streptomyces sp. NPDC052109]|uniref:hypothetical protein n=1 Tax=Streptomyces sp. NPDC052109 TaxID=3155527 RepID=UPI00342A32F5